MHYILFELFKNSSTSDRFEGTFKYLGIGDNSIIGEIPVEAETDFPLLMSYNNDRTQLYFEMNYKSQLLSGTILFSNDKIWSQSDTQGLKLDVEEDGNRISGIIRDLNNGEITFDINFVNIRDLNRDLRLSFFRRVLQREENSTENTQVLQKLNKLINKKMNNNIVIEFTAQTDLFGLNFSEMTGIITADVNYPNGYPKKLIGYCEGIINKTFRPQTFYSFRPKIQKPLKETGDTLLAQTNNINNIYDTGLSNCDFYLNIIAYCTFRYMLAGFSNNFKFSLKWLYANHYQQFLKNLKNSEFSGAIVIFTEPQQDFDFTNFNQYFENCSNKS